MEVQELARWLSLTRKPRYTSQSEEEEDDSNEERDDADVGDILSSATRVANQMDHMDSAKGNDDDDDDDQGDLPKPTGTRRRKTRSGKGSSS